MSCRRTTNADSGSIPLLCGSAVLRLGLVGLEGGGAGVPVRKPVPVGLVDHPGAAGGGAGAGGQPAAAVDAERPDG